MASALSLIAKWKIPVCKPDTNMYSSYVIISLLVYDFSLRCCIFITSLVQFLISRNHAGFLASIYYYKSLPCILYSILDWVSCDVVFYFLHIKYINFIVQDIITYHGILFSRKNGIGGRGGGKGE